MLNIIPKNIYPYYVLFNSSKTGNTISTGYTPTSLLTFAANLVT